jgi:hypothetical protein
MFLTNGAGRSVVETGFRYRDALRLLFILHAGARPIEQPDPNGAVAVFEGEKRLMAIDFWIRYPDHLANHLLDLYVETKDPKLLAEIESIFDQEEPDVRLIKVLRWRYGAFDRIEDALAILSARNLVKPMKKKIPTGSQHDFLIFPSASSFLKTAVQDQPDLKWYQDRTRLALLIAGDKSGSSLKAMQYETPEYGNTMLSAVIPSIKDRVHQRLKDVKAGK